ncbi:DUF1444 domain-containing protein [Chitinimonas naiadis]
MSFLDRIFKPSRDAFAMKYLAGLRELGDQRPWRYDGGRFHLVLEGGEADQAVISLGTMYAEHCALPRKQRAQQLQNVVRAMVSEVPQQFALAKANLLPAIKHLTEREQAALMLDAHERRTSFPAQSLCGELEVAVMYDSEFSMSRLTAKQFSEWGVRFEDALAVAMENLRDRSVTPMQAVVPGLYVSDWGDYFDASRMLLTDLLYRHSISGAPVVMVPNRTCLLLTGDRDEAGLTRMLALAEEVLAQPRPLSAQMLRWDGGQWTVFQPSIVAEKLGELQFADLANSYGVQKELLDEQHERGEVDIFVATFMAMRDKENGRLFSVSTWSNGVHTLLPVTDSVALRSDDSEGHLLVAWADLQQVCGALMQATEDYPPRYEVRAYPDAAQLAALAERTGKVA